MHRRSAPCRSAFLAFAMVSLATLLLPAVGHAALPSGLDLLWAATEVGADEGRSLYQGPAGRILAVPAERTGALVARGAARLALEPGEQLFVYLVEDGLRAQFEAPARVLARAPREVVLALPAEADAPRLTDATNATLRGLRQPVRVPLDRVTESPASREVEAPSMAREVDPLVALMVSELTSVTYQPKWQTLDDFETRQTYQPANVQATQWMLEQFQSYGLDAEFHLYLQNGAQRRNVIATLPGVVDPTKVIYLCGHLDSTSPTPSVCAPGADDNGSGTAAVLEAARIMCGYSFEYTVKFALFNGEEQGLLGSAAYASYVAGLGEDIIAVYNMDMIAYRGTDPAPPDLVIYTNSASQAVAASLENAFDTYLPGQIEPVILVEALAASDHASFWDHGYHAICSIEEEAWGSDFCPWYHTCDDRIERYPQDYPVACARGNLAAAAVAAITFAPAGPYLVLGGSTVDDDVVGESNGNGDGAFNPGETIELSITLHNAGSTQATGVTGLLSSGAVDVTVVDGTGSWNPIPAGGDGTSLAPFLLQVSGTAPHGATVPLTLAVTDQSGSRNLPLQFNIIAPILGSCFYRIDDAPAGNGNGVIDPGEVVDIAVRLRNSGGQNAASVTANMSAGSEGVTVLEESSGAALIAAGQEVELAPLFRVAVAAGATEGTLLDLDLALGANSGYTASSALRIKVGTSYYDEVEGLTTWALGAAGDNATSGLWTIGDPIGTVYNGQPAQTEDDHTAPPGARCFFTGQGSVGGAAGEADVDGGTTTLVSPMFDLTRHDAPRVTYWRWYTNNLGNNPGADEWVVQVSSNGGTNWVDLERTTQSANSWQEISHDLAGLITPSSQVVFRFVATDLSPGSLVEAAIDDFEISGTVTTVAVEDPPVVATLSLYSPRPHPLAPGGLVEFALPGTSEVRLSLFAPDGRQVRVLAEGSYGAGAHRLEWDGFDAAHRPLAAGVYFLRLEAGAEIRSRTVVLRP